MPKIKIDNKEYDSESLPEEANAQIFHIKAIDFEINRIKTLIAVLQTAKSSYTQALKVQIEKLKIQ
jgi:hypothetical protein